ncbi:MAG: hypothetical protein KDB92_08265, partial [Chitinophagaceae bacterium]|nr:hypothetical protein [Chitinophagaceae bacterium]
QGVGVVLLRKKYGTSQLPFKIWLYPIPVVISILVWLFLLVSTGWFAFWGSLFAVLGVVIFLLKDRISTR